MVLERAKQKVGGFNALAERLGVRPSALALYINGTEPISEVLYLKAVDIVLGEPVRPPPARPSDPSKKRRPT